MIRQLEDTDWAWLCNQAGLGNYIASTLVDDDLVEEAEDDLTFSDAQAMVKVGLNNTFLYYIFSNEGLVNIMTEDGKTLLDTNNQSEYELYKLMPKLAGVNMKFYGYMEAKFGGQYSVPLMTLTDIKIREAKKQKDNLGSQIAMYSAYNTNKNAKVPHDIITDYVMLYGKANIQELSEEYNYCKRYIKVLNIIQETLMESYVSEELDKEMEELMSKRPTLVQDESDPKIIHFIPPQK